MESYYKILRFNFVIFSLYLMGDAFSRWDGVRYYASISEFLPAVALVFLLWTTLAAFISLLMWLAVKLLTLLFRGLKLDDLFIFCISFILIASLIYAGKSVWKDIEMTKTLKFLLLSGSLFAAFLVTWLLRRKSEMLFRAINDRINPLVWLFGVLLIVSIPLVAYKIWGQSNMRGPLNEGLEFTESAVDRPNILLVTFDALTARNMSAYGYGRETTPFIRQWAETASLFSHVKSGSNYTTPTSASLMTGKRLWTHQTYFVEVVSQYVAGNNENLPFLLKQNGYSNIALQQISTASVEKLGLGGSFDIVFRPDNFGNTTTLYKYLDKYLYRMFGEKIMIYDWLIKEDFILFKFITKLSSDSSITYQRPESAFTKFLDILDSGQREPYFAWIHLFPPHDPYLPPEPYKGMFNSSQKLRTWKSQIKIWKKKDKEILTRYMDTFRDRYDEFIRYADSQYENFMHQFEKRNGSKDTVIILSADHGESFAHDYLGHGGPHLYEDMTHIPLVIKEPGQRKGRIIDYLSEQIDISSTILEFAKISQPAWMEGRSLIPLIRGKGISARPAFSMSLYENPVEQYQIIKGTIALWEGDYKLIHYLNDGTSMLFNFKEDPDELNNLFDLQSDTGQRLLSLIKENLAKANERIRWGHEY